MDLFVLAFFLACTLFRKAQCDQLDHSEYLVHGNPEKLYDALGAGDSYGITSLFSPHGVWNVEGMQSAIGRHAVLELTGRVFETGVTNQGGTSRTKERRLVHKTIDSVVAATENGETAAVAVTVARHTTHGNGITAERTAYWIDTILIVAGQIEAMYSARGSAVDIEKLSDEESPYQVTAGAPDARSIASLKDIMNQYFAAYNQGNAQIMTKLFAKAPKSRVYLSADCSDCGTEILISSGKMFKKVFKNITLDYTNIDFKITDAKVYGELGWITTEQAGCSGFPYTQDAPMHLNAVWLMTKEKKKWRIHSVAMSDAISPTLQSPMNDCRPSSRCIPKGKTGSCLLMTPCGANATCSGMTCSCNDGFCATIAGTCLPITTTTTTQFGNTHEPARATVPRPTMPIPVYAPTPATTAPVIVARTPVPETTKPAAPRAKRARPIATTTTPPAPAPPFCSATASVGRCLVTGCFIEHGRTANCSHTHCYCKPGFCTTDNRTCITTPSLSMLEADDSMSADVDEDEKDDDEAPQANETNYAVFASIVGLSVVLIAAHAVSAKRGRRHDGKLTSPLL